MRKHEYFVYILTNIHKTVLYTGVTNDLARRLAEHTGNEPNTFTGRYNCVFLLYHEKHRYIDKAIAREKEIKGWRRAKKESLINEFNPGWLFLNDEL